MCESIIVFLMSKTNLLATVFLVLFLSELALSKEFIDDDFVLAVKLQLDQWVGYQNNQTFKEALVDCKFEEIKSELESLYVELRETGQNFTLKHIDVLRKVFKEKPAIKEVISCITDKRVTQNPYFNQQKRYKFLARFVKSHSGYSKGVFPQFYSNSQKGRLIGHFFKAFFEYYYVNIYNPSETLSTSFIRALTVRSDIFNHIDISYCLSLETAGAISNQLEGLDINNIYEKLPKFFEAFKYLKFKEKCKDQEHREMARNLESKIGNIDLYRLMYHDYQPYVEIAAEKFGTAQLRKLAKKIAEIIDNYKKYVDMSNQQF